MSNKLTLVTILIFVGIMACTKIENIGPLGPCDLSAFPYNPTPYTVVQDTGLPAMEHPADNPITVQGIELGRHLFYDPILSRDSTISCSSCHKLNQAFTDGLAKAEGIDNRIGRRGSMSLINIGYQTVQNKVHNFMWDGRFESLEQQVVEGPIEDPFEMDNTWEKAEADLRKHPTYPKMFREAFGINCTEDITRHLVGKAIAQFERTLNSANSKYDLDQWTNGIYFTEQELRGFEMFLGDANGNTSSAAKDAACAHCHSFSKNKALFAGNNYTNNGLDSVANFSQFVDYGHGDITGNAPQNGMFKEVTLRNIALTAPYMHDGRFETLEEVVDHYATGGHAAPNLSSIITPDLQLLNANDKADLVAFLHSLTDTSYFDKPEWSSPF